MASGNCVLVTGASGFVGSALVRRLVQLDYRVRALVRPTSRTAHLRELSVELVEGDVRDAPSVAAALAGVQRVFHVAADYRLWAANPQDIVETNVMGTVIVMTEAARAGVERVVYTSSVATLRLNDDGSPADESRSLDAADAFGAYKGSKIAAEQAVQAAAADGLPVVIVNPSTPIGPYDFRPTPTGRLILNAAAGRIPGFVETGLNFVCVDDVAAGHIAAMERGRVGERYILGGQNVALAELLTFIATETGRTPPVIKIPRAMIAPIAVGAELAARFTGREPFITRAGLHMSARHMYFTAGKAERELGFRARPYTDGVREAIGWFRRAGYLPAAANQTPWSFARSRHQP
jgi:dihydroflavonol-4-reductase